MSTKLSELLQDLAEPKPAVEIRTNHDGRTIASAEKQLLIMEYEGPGGSLMFMRTELGDAKLVLEGTA